MKRNNLLLLIILSVHLGSTAQQGIALRNNQVFIASIARFLNYGGEGFVPNEYLKATTKAPLGYLVSEGGWLHTMKGNDNRKTRVHR